VREKKWHESQQLRELKDGGVELSLKLSSLMEISRWVLSWGGRATVVRPQALRDRLLGVGQGYVRRYAQSGG